MSSSGKAPRTCRWLVWAASGIVPRRLRREWKSRWDREIWNWWAFFAQHGAFDRQARGELVRHCWSAFPDAIAARFDNGARLAAVLRNPLFCLALAAMPLLGVAIWSGGFPGLRTLLEPLPYAEPGRLVLLGHSHPYRPESIAGASVTAWRGALRLAGLAAYTASPARLNGRNVLHGRAERGFFELLGTRPALGGAFDDAQPPAAVISHDLWRREFRSDPAAVGRTTVIDGRKFRITGVLAEGFWFHRREIAVWTALEIPPPTPGPAPSLGTIARLKPFAQVRDTELELSNIAWNLSPQHGIWVELFPIVERRGFALQWYGVLFALVLAAAMACAAAEYRAGPVPAAFMVAKTALLAGGLAAFSIEVPAALGGGFTAGRGYLAEIWFLAGAPLVVRWCRQDQRRRCRTCLRRLTLPVSFGNLGSPLLERVGTELVCERGHGTLYVPGLDWSSSGPERWTTLDSSWRDLFTSGR